MSYNSLILYILYAQLHPEDSQLIFEQFAQFPSKQLGQVQLQPLFKIIISFFYVNTSIRLSVAKKDA